MRRVDFRMAKETEQVFSADQINLLRQSLQPLALAHDVYNTNSTKDPDGWKVVASSSPPGEWESGFFAQIYEKVGPLAPGESRYVAAFRGTDSIKDKKNLDADLQIIFRKLPNQHNEGLAFVKGFCEKNNINPAEVALTGHSLGGYLAITIGMALGTERIWAFNSPGPTREVRNELSNKIPGISKPPCKGLVQVRSTHDLISRWQYAEGKVIDIKTPGFHHKLLNLQVGIEAILSGQPLKPDLPGKKTLSSVFNALSSRLAMSGTVSKIINKLFGSQSAHKPLDCGCG
jgi:hypothetical protein